MTIQLNMKTATIDTLLTPRERPDLGINIRSLSHHRKVRRTIMKAITIKEISGDKIPTIPIGTEFTVICRIEDKGSLQWPSRVFCLE